MTKPQDNPRRTIGHLKRLIREGEDLLHNRPLDEWAHAKWTDRAIRYLKRKMPDFPVPTAYELQPVQMPDFMSPNYKKPHPLDVAMTRSENGQKRMRKLVPILTSAAERLEL